MKSRRHPWTAARDRSRKRALDGQANVEPSRRRPHPLWGLGRHRPGRFCARLRLAPRRPGHPVPMGLMGAGGNYTGNVILTLDPFDTETQEMWRSKGLRNSQTIDDAGELKRLYLPLAGRYMGPFDRGLKE